MNSSVTIGSKIRAVTPSWAKPFVETTAPDESSIAVEWLIADEVIVLETLAEPA